MVRTLVLSLVLVSFVAALVGCNAPDAPKPNPPKKSSNTTS
jgi:hypothetical protein